MRIALLLLALLGCAWGAQDEEENHQDDYNQAEFSEEDHHLDSNAHQFLPKNMLSLELGEAPNCFFHDIEHVPANIRGAWFVSTAGTPTVHVVAKLLGRKPLTLLDEQESDKDRGEFTLEAKTIGTYSFCFENSEPQEPDSKILTFSIDVVSTNTNRDQIAKPEHVKQIVELTKDLKSTISSLQTELEVILLRFSAQAESQDFVEQRVSWFTLLESLAILLMACGQIYYVRRLVNGKVNRLWV